MAGTPHYALYDDPVTTPVPPMFKRSHNHACIKVSDVKGYIQTKQPYSQKKDAALHAAARRQTWCY